MKLRDLSVGERFILVRTGQHFAVSGKEKNQLIPVRLLKNSKTMSFHPCVAVEVLDARS
ncbi:hypothetical protein [Pseudoalteromonas piratica]|uniref:hypothetical protein n=1 Tax=Pseudoalteromonas piratica TaxID=1348114 RepID=UPI000B062F8F|nr:hypothetical protein [Pseudoalteromonas piratica]